MDASGRRARAKDRGWAGAIVVLAGVLTISGLTRATVASSPKGSSAGVTVSLADQQGHALLKRMSEALAKLKRFNVIADESAEVASKGGGKVRFDTVATISVERPNRMRADRKGDLSDISFYYDSGTLTLWAHRTNFYAKVVVPPTLDGALEAARERLEVDLPAAELLATDVSRELERNVSSARFMGKETIRGVDCMRIDLRGDNWVSQLWMEEGSRSLPCRYVTVNESAGSLRTSIEFRNWDLNPAAAPDPFAFQPTVGAERIPFIEMIETVPRPRGRPAQ
jgi:hypothetical protein